MFHKGFLCSRSVVKKMNLPNFDHFFSIGAFLSTSPFKESTGHGLVSCCVMKDWMRYMYIYYKIKILCFKISNFPIGAMLNRARLMGASKSSEPGNICWKCYKLKAYGIWFYAAKWLRNLSRTAFLMPPWYMASIDVYQALITITRKCGWNNPTPDSLAYTSIHILINME